MIFIVVILIILDLYAYRLVRDLSLHKSVRWIYWAVNILIYSYFLSALLSLPEWTTHMLSIYFRAFVLIYTLAKLLFIFPLVLEDVFGAFRWILQKLRPPAKVSDESITQPRQQFVKNISVTLAGLPFLIMGHGVMRNIYRYRVIRQKLKVEGLPEELNGLRIVQISDIHAGTFPQVEPVLKGVEMVNELRPDIFVFTGDLVNSTAEEVDPFIPYFSRIKARYGRFSIMGNHDYGDYHRWKSEREKSQNDAAFEEKHQKLGWELLRNEHRVIEIGGSRLGIIGVENYSTLPRFPRKGDMQKAVAGMEETDFLLLLSHDPTHWEAEVVPHYPKVDLTLSGHTHGFQFGFEIRGIGRWSPAQYIYKQWAGMYQTKNQSLYVNRGYGVLGYPGRVGILPEVTLIELESV